MADAVVAGKASTDTGTETKDEKTAGTVTPEQKAIDDKAAADKKTADDAAAAKKKTDDDAAAATLEAGKKKVPEKYELAIPKDATDWLDAADLKTIESVARAKGWTQEEAQGALAEHAEQLVAQSKAFRAETEADKTYGGDHLAETQRLASLALDKVRPATTEQGKALRAMLAKTGYGNNLLVVSLLADLGKMMDEDTTHLTAGASRGTTKDPAEKLYGPEKTS